MGNKNTRSISRLKILHGLIQTTCHYGCRLLLSGREAAPAGGYPGPRALLQRIASYPAGFLRSLFLAVFSGVFFQPEFLEGLGFNTFLLRQFDHLIPVCA